MVEKHGFAHLSAGDLLREEVKLTFSGNFLTNFALTYRETPDQIPPL